MSAKGKNPQSDMNTGYNQQNRNANTNTNQNQTQSTTQPQKKTPGGK